MLLRGGTSRNGSLVIGGFQFGRNRIVPHPVGMLRQPPAQVVLGGL
jgi:hypothetical protein